MCAEKHCFFAEHCHSIDLPWLFMQCHPRLKWRLSQSTFTHLSCPSIPTVVCAKGSLLKQNGKNNWEQLYPGKFPIADTNNRIERIINRTALHYWPIILIFDHGHLFFEWERYINLFDSCYIFLAVYCILSFLQHQNSSVTTLPAFQSTTFTYLGNIHCSILWKNVNCS